MPEIELKIHEVMGKKRLKITDLERGANITYAAAHSLYHGKNKMLRLDVLARVCEFLDVTPGDILIYVPDKEVNDQ